MGDTRDLVTFGPYRFDRRQRRLERDGAAVALGRRALEVLGVLLAADGAVVSKDRLLAEAWPGLTVDENNLQVQVSALRKVLGEGWIVTVSGEGYRLVGEGGGAVLADHPLVDGEPSIAVMRFADPGGDAEQGYFAEGIADEIISALSRVRSFLVIARGSSFVRNSRTEDVKRIGRELGARYVLDGSVIRTGGRVRVTVQLIETVTGTHVWVERFEHAIEDIFALHDRVAEGVVVAIAPALLKAELGRVSRKPTESATAYDLALRAVSICMNHSYESFREALLLVRKAVEIDPGYSQAQAHLSYCCWGMVCFAPFEREDLTSYRNEVVDAAKRALVHGGDLPEVLAICAWGLGVVGGDLAFGLELAQRATELSPSSEAGWRIAGWIHLYLDDSEPAMACFNRAIRLAPMPGNPGALLGLSAVHFAAGRHDEVLLVTERALRYSPGFVMALRNRAASLGLLGRIDEGRRVVQQLRQLVPAFSLGYVRDHFRLDLNNAYRSPEMIEAMLDGLRRVGTPE